MKKLMWGLALLAIAKKSSSGYGDFKKFPEIVEGSLSLVTTKGEKKEAKVEGGGVEAVKYSKNTYGLEASFRRGLDASDNVIKLPFEDDLSDGVVDGVYYLRVQPEDKTAGGISVKEVVITTEDTHTSADGAIVKVTFDFIKPEPNSDGTQDETIDWSPIADLTAAVTAPGS